MASDLLIPDAGPLVIRQRTGRRGRGATAPVVQELTADRPNPAGLRTLRVKFRPLERHWDAIQDPFDDRPKSRWRVALNLLWEHFRLIGGFRLADDALVRIVADALVFYPPEQIRWALSAKAHSLTGADREEARAKRVFVPRPERFYEPRSLDYWIEQSPEGRAAAADRDRRALSERLDSIRAGSVGVPPPSPATPAGPASVPGSSGGPASPPVSYPELPAVIQLAIADQARNTQLLELLGERRRRIAERTVEQDRRDYQWFFDQVAEDEHLTKVVRLYLLAQIAVKRFPDVRRAYAELGPTTEAQRRRDET